jgi:hypothetical protein
MDEDQRAKQPIYRIATEAEQPSARIIARAKRDINRNWHKFWEKRGIDPNHVGAENGFKPRSGRPRKHADDAGGGDGGGELPSSAEAAMD